MSTEPDPPRLDELKAIMARLRDPQHGCPWDRQQDFASIAPYTIEEAYEVADAIERGDMADLRAELGDLLFQVVFHSQMAEEMGAFTLSDVIAGICDKMRRRHPHVFGTREQIAAGPQAGSWERLKAQERAAKAPARPDDEKSALDHIARTLPAMIAAQKFQEQAAHYGFDWSSPEPVFDKLEEEIAELKAARTNPEDEAHIAEEMGDILFVCINLSRKLGLNAEAVLRQANAKFARRFAWIERQLSKAGKTLDEASLAEMERYWNEAKANERKP